MRCLRISVCIALLAAASSMILPAPSFAQAAAPASPGSPSQAEPPPPVPAPPAPAVTDDPFGLEVTLEAKTIVYMKGTATWETAFETLVDAFKSVNGFVEKQGLKPAGLPLAIYTQTDDTGFQYQTGIPIAEEPKTRPRGDITIGKSPDGKMLKFVHRGSYDSMDTTYEAITNHLDEKRIEAKDIFIEEYVTDPLKTPEDKLVVNVYVPLK
jgi:effector-binding domain-containing protein